MGELRRRVRTLENSVGDSMGKMEDCPEEVEAIVEALLSVRSPSAGQVAGPESDVLPVYRDLT